MSERDPVVPDTERVTLVRERGTTSWHSKGPGVYSTGYEVRTFITESAYDQQVARTEEWEARARELSEKEFQVAEELEGARATYNKRMGKARAIEHAARRLVKAYGPALDADIGDGFDALEASVKDLEAALDD